MKLLRPVVDGYRSFDVAVFIIAIAIVVIIVAGRLQSPTIFYCVSGSKDMGVEVIRRCPQYCSYCLRLS